MNNLENRQFPEIGMTDETAPFWQAAAEGRFVIKKCLDCGDVHYYPRALCPHCLSDKTEWMECKGEGEIYTYSVMRRAPVVYAIAYIRLSEGVTVLSNIVDCDFDNLQIGQAVKAVFHDTGKGYTLPLFTPAT